jgi:hypothetical protein
MCDIAAIIMPGPGSVRPNPPPSTLLWLSQVPDLVTVALRVWVCRRFVGWWVAESRAKGHLPGRRYSRNAVAAAADSLIQLLNE